jgi:hypothetical protein
MYITIHIVNIHMHTSQFLQSDLLVQILGSEDGDRERNMWAWQLRRFALDDDDDSESD